MAAKSDLNKGRPLRVLIDMDGVLCDFEGYFLEHFAIKHADECIPLEKRNTYYIHEQYDKSLKQEILDIWESEGFFRKMPRMDGAIEALEEMSGVENVQVFICTSPLIPSKNYFSFKEKFEWVKQYLGKDWEERIIVTKDKTVINGDILIDDKPEITGVEANPSWDHILFTYWHNRHLDIREMRCTQRLDNWSEPKHWKSLIDKYKKKIAEK